MKQFAEIIPNMTDEDYEPFNASTARQAVDGLLADAVEAFATARSEDDVSTARKLLNAYKTADYAVKTVEDLTADMAEMIARVSKLETKAGVLPEFIAPVDNSGATNTESASVN